MSALHFLNRFPVRWSCFVPSVSDALDIDFLPSLDRLAAIQIKVVASADDLEYADNPHWANAFLAATEDEPPADGWTWEQLKELGFAGKVGQTITFPNSRAASNVLVGIGDADRADADTFREAGAAFARALGKKTSGCVNFEGRGSGNQVEAFIEGALLARYNFDTFVTKNGKDSKGLPPLQQLVVVTGEGISVADAEKAAGLARVFARAAMVARDLTNLPPAHLTSEKLGDLSAQLADRFGFAVEVFDLEQLKAMGCGGLVAVNRGSTHEARMVKLSYEPQSAPEDAKHLALVGKGITFDSGGLSLKPATAMVDMKMDMGGAAAVLGAFTSMKDLGVKVPVEGWIATTDNMISGDSLRVGEILTARNGKTVEVNNTDAEGRLVLMDALSLACESDPTWMVDIATLTGAQVVALGTEIAAVLGNDPELVEAVKDAAEDTGEKVWELPLEKRYLKIMDSPVADIANANMSNRAAGTITAGLFLSQFVGDIPWAHIDIAGPMSSATADRWLAPGATGFGARLLLDLAENLGEETFD